MGCGHSASQGFLLATRKRNYEIDLTEPSLRDAWVSDILGAQAGEIHGLMHVIECSTFILATCRDCLHHHRLVPACITFSEDRPIFWFYNLQPMERERCFLVYIPPG
eukprot:8844113-Pyramimonas_sp.AAC.3